MNRDDEKEGGWVKIHIYYHYLLLIVIMING